jgi:hypothetical protein
VLVAVSAAAKSSGVICDTLHVEHELIYQAIIEAAEARKCDLIVMASHGRRGVSAVVLGSETVKVLTHNARARASLTCTGFFGRNIEPALECAEREGRHGIRQGPHDAIAQDVWNHSHLLVLQEREGYGPG